MTFYASPFIISDILLKYYVKVTLSSCLRYEGIILSPTCIMSTSCIFAHRGLWTDSVTKFKRALLQKPITFQLIKNFPLTYGVLNFINVFTSEFWVLTPVTENYSPLWCAPCCLVNIYRSYAGTCFLHLQVYSSLNMEAEHSCKMSVNIYQTTQGHTTENGNLHVCSRWPGNCIPR
jgi:hypothetical protein